MTGRRGSHSDDGTDPIVDIIDLEPVDAARLHRDSTAVTSVRRRGWPAVIALVVLVALTVSVIANRGHGSTRATTATATTNARRANLDFGRPGDTAPMFPFRVGAQVLTGGATGLRLADTDTGTVTDLEIVGLPLGPATIVAESGGTVAVRVGADLYWFTMKTRAANSVASAIGAVTAFPSARRGSLWFAGARSAIEVPNGRTPIATPGPALGATSAGLLVSTRAGVVLQPTSGEAGRMLLRAPATVIAVHADRVAWIADECGVLRCPVHVTEVKSGATSSWLQLGGNSRTSAVGGASAAFSPDGSRLAIVVPDAGGTRAATLVLADLRSRATSALAATGRVDVAAQPGTDGANGTTLAWTIDGAYLVLGPAVEAIGDRIAVVDPAAAVIVAGRANVHVGSSVATVGVSSTGPLDLPRRGDPGPVDSSATPGLHLPGLSLVGVDDLEVEVLDLGSDTARRDPVSGVMPNPAGPHSIARVTGGWLVVRDGGVELVPDVGSARPGGLVDAGSLVFSANHGRDAWIAIATSSAVWRVAPHDPVTGTTGTAVAVGFPVGTVDQGLIVTVFAANGVTDLDLVDRSSNVRQVAAIDSPDARVLSTGGHVVAYSDSAGLHVLDLANGTRRLVDPNPIARAELSPDGTALAWVDGTRGGPTVRAMRVASTISYLLGDGPADRVLVADDGTVLYTTDMLVHRGRVDANGSAFVPALAPETSAALALG